MTEEVKVEVIKWHQRLQEIAYIEAGLHMRALNQLMWQVPSFVIAINGGLWYGTTLVAEPATRMIFLMVAVFDLLSIVTLYRLRALLSGKIELQKKIESQCVDSILNELSEAHFPDAHNKHIRLIRKKIKNDKRLLSKNKNFLSNSFERMFSFIKKYSGGDYTVIGCWSTVLFLCSFISLCGLAFPSVFIDKKEKEVKYEIKNMKNGDEYIILKK